MRAPRSGWVTSDDLYRAVLERDPYPVRGLVGFGANLALSRADAGQYPVTLREFYLDELIADCVQSLRSLAAAKCVSLFSHSEGELPILADESLVRRMLLNLLDNAIKYSPQDGPVTVSLRYTDDDYVEIAVEDQGIGVSPEDQARLTERFFRAENAQNIDSKGLGLGLYLVNALVTKHGGSLSIKSEGISGAGSTFIIKLPYRNR